MKGVHLNTAGFGDKGVDGKNGKRTNENTALSKMIPVPDI